MVNEAVEFANPVLLPERADSIPDVLWTRLIMTMNTQTPARELTFSQAINEAIRQEMRRDPAIIIMGEDIAGAAGRAHLGFSEAWGGPLRATRGLFSEFGRQRASSILRFPRWGSWEPPWVPAMTGLRPIVELMFVDLIGCCYDQIDEPRQPRCAT